MTKKWHRPQRAGFPFGAALRVLASATDPTEWTGTVCDVRTDGDGRAVSVLVATTAEAERLWVPAGRVLLEALA